MNNIEDNICPMMATQQVIGGKWKIMILWFLKDEKKRFSEIQRYLPDTTRKMLTQQLRSLESDSLINRYVHAVVPPKVEYSLTEEGKAIVPILDMMCEWGADYLEKHNEEFTD